MSGAHAPDCVYEDTSLVYDYGGLHYQAQTHCCNPHMILSYQCTL